MKIALKRIVLMILLLGMAPMMDSGFITAGDNAKSDCYVEAASSTVWICTGPNAKKYHRSSKCRGLRKCSCSIVKCSQADAEAKCFRPCKICY